MLMYYLLQLVKILPYAAVSYFSLLIHTSTQRSRVVDLPLIRMRIKSKATKSWRINVGIDERLYHLYTDIIVTILIMNIIRYIRCQIILNCGLYRLGNKKFYI